jgi:hypothetical protein
MRARGSARVREVPCRDFKIGKEISGLPRGV